MLDILRLWRVPLNRPVGSLSKQRREKVLNEMNELDRRAMAISPQPGTPLSIRAKQLMFKIVMAVLAFMLAIMWTDAFKRLFNKVWPWATDSTSHAVCIAVVVTAITLAVGLWYVESEPRLTVSNGNEYLDTFGNKGA